MALKKVGKLKKTERWRMNGQNKEAVNTVNYLVSHWRAQEIGTNRKKNQSKMVSSCHSYGQMHSGNPQYNDNMLENIC